MDPLSDYEKLFTPSFYPKKPQNRESVLASWANEQDRCLNELINEYEHEFDVSYGSENVDIWYPKKRTEPEKVYVFTHGG